MSKIIENYSRKYKNIEHYKNEKIFKIECYEIDRNNEDDDVLTDIEYFKDEKLYKREYYNSSHPYGRDEDRYYDNVTHYYDDDMKTIKIEYSDIDYQKTDNIILKKVEFGDGECPIKIIWYSSEGITQTDYYNDDGDIISKKVWTKNEVITQINYYDLEEGNVLTKEFYEDKVIVQKEHMGWNKEHWCPIITKIDFYKDGVLSHSKDIDEKDITYTETWF